MIVYLVYVGTTLIAIFRNEKKADEYIAKWHEFAQQYVDDCSIIHFGTLDWFWNYRQGLHCDYEGNHPYFFNAYWDNPEEHQR